MNIHLTEEQFAACAMGEEQTPQTAAHLAECDACREELAAFAASVGSFNTESLAWGEAQPAESLRPQASKTSAQPVWAVASWALAGCLAVLSGVSIENHYRVNQAAVGKSPARLAEDSAAQIERDNKLLLAVSEATSIQAVSPLQEYGLEDAHPGRQVTPKTPNEDD